jgi:hypothetical protein
MNNKTREKKQNTARIDQALASAESAKIAKLVRNLPEDDPSMAWRSALNERLIEAARRRKVRRSWARIWVPAAGLGTSAAIAASVFFLWVGVPSREVAPELSLEASMVSAHRDNVRFSELAGPGLSESDAVANRQAGNDDGQWKESDLEAM